jgi:hypothetical protein
MRWLGLVALGFSLLGWSGWWVICNVYEFAPRLPEFPLAMAWLLGLAVMWRTLQPRRMPVAAAWVMAALNAGWVAATHQGMEAAASPLYLGSAIALLGWATMRLRRAASAPVLHGR